MDILRGLFGIKRMVRVPNARIRELCGVTKAVDGSIGDSAKWGEWRMIGLLIESIYESVLVVAQLAGRGGDEMIL